jgi:hypothetical protein
MRNRLFVMPLYTETRTFAKSQDRLGTNTLKLKKKDDTFSRNQMQFLSAEGFNKMPLYARPYARDLIRPWYPWKGHRASPLNSALVDETRA